MAAQGEEAGAGYGLRVKATVVMVEPVAPPKVKDGRGMWEW